MWLRLFNGWLGGWMPKQQHSMLQHLVAGPKWNFAYSSQRILNGSS